MWSEKYRPKKVEEIIGNEEARLALFNWYRTWKPGDKAALLLGPPGTGKTTLAHLLAEHYNLNLVELNASDTRTKESLSKRIGEVLNSANLLSDGSLIFLDEVDGLAGRADHGATDFIKESIKSAQNPIVMAANGPESERVRKLLDSSLAIRLRPPPPREVEMYLRVIARREQMSLSEKELAAAVIASKGDLRYATNSIQSFGGSGQKDAELTAAQALDAFFEAADPAAALRALRSYPGQPRDKLRDICSSVIAARLTPEARAEMLEVLSRADLLMGRIVKGGDWRLLRYLDAMLVHELRPLIGDGGVFFAQESLPWNMRVRIWNDSRKVREMGAALAQRLHTGRRNALVQDLAYLFAMCSTKKMRAEVSKSMNLDEPFMKFLEKEALKVARAG